MPQVPFVVRCINVNGISDAKDRYGLVIGDCYEVLEETSNNLYVLSYTTPYGLKNPRWKKDKFEVVENTSKSNPLPSTQTTAATNTDEEHCWRMMRPRLNIGDCICGINKQECSYHR